MRFGTADLQKVGIRRSIAIGVVPLLLMCTALVAQTTDKPRNIFDDDNTPPANSSKNSANPAAPRPAAPPAVAVPAPAPALEMGLLATLYAGPTTAAPEKEHHITPGLGINFEYPATNDFIPMAFSFRGSINIPAGAGQGSFHIVSTGESDVLIDGKPVSSIHAGAGAPNFNESLNLTPGLHTLSATVIHLRSTGARQQVLLIWMPFGSPSRRIPKEWCWHNKADEPADVTRLTRTSAPSAPSAVSPVARSVRLPIPDAAAQAKTAAELRQRYASAWSDPGTEQQAVDLMRAADQSRDDAMASYVLLDQAAQRAQSAGAWPIAFRAIDLLASQFTVNALHLKLAVLQSPATRKPLDPAANNALVALFNQAMADTSYLVASDAANLLLADARQRNSSLDMQTAEQRLVRATAANAELEKIKPALAALAENPNDPAANLAAGKFYCFIARDWERGVPALARSIDPVFSWLGRHEQSANYNPEAQLQLANGWWDAADAQDEPLVTAMRERAAQWYRAAAPRLMGLSARVAQRRIAKIPALATLPSPLAVPASPQQVIASAPVAPTPIPGSGASQPGVAQPRPPAQVNPGFVRSPGPLLLVVDRAVLVPAGAHRVSLSLRGSIHWVEDAASVTLIIPGTPPQIFNFTAGEYAANQALRNQIEAALQIPGSNDVAAALQAALAKKPARLELYLEAHAALDPLAAIVNAQDPDRAMFRTVRFWSSPEDRDLGMSKVGTVRTVFGGQTMTSLDYSSPPR